MATPFQAFNVITGKNGSGKSSFLRQQNRRVFDLKVSSLRGSTSPFSVNEVVTIQPSGEDLAALLWKWRQNDMPRFKAVEATVRDFFPEVSQIAVNLDDDVVNISFHGHDLLPPLTYSSLYSVAAYAALVQLTHKNDVCIEHPETGVHPEHYPRLIALLRNITMQGVKVFIATTHPYLLDNFNPTEVFITHRAGHTAPKLYALADHPNLQRYNGILSTGEFIASEGEDALIAKIGTPILDL